MLKFTKGSLASVKYPTRLTVQADLLPRDYFEPVGGDVARSCVPAGGEGFSFQFDANSGKMTLRGPDVLPPLSVTFEVDNTWNAVFVGRCMQVSQEISSQDELDAVLTHVEYTLPSLLSVATNLAVSCESIQLGLGCDDYHLEARVETCIPPFETKLVEPKERVAELSHGIKLLGLARSSARFTLAASYAREAMFLVASYHDHNPYTHSLLVILKCAQAIEVLFGGGQRDTIRDRCRRLSIDDGVIESQIMSIVVTRNELGSAHASGFVPDPNEVEILRRFAQRSVHTVRELLLHLDRASNEERALLSEQIKRSADKVKLLQRLKENLEIPPWSVDSHLPREVEIMNDPRQYPPGHYLRSNVVYRFNQ
jgi:hypothetical protein